MQMPLETDNLRQSNSFQMVLIVKSICVVPSVVLSVVLSVVPGLVSWSIKTNHAYNID